MGERLQKIIETIKDKQIDTWAVILGISLTAAGFLAVNLYPKAKDQKSVVTRETALGFNRSFGYDFDKDGKLDYAKQWSNAGRAGTFSMTLHEDSLEFKALQDKYSKQKK